LMQPLCKQFVKIIQNFASFQAFGSIISASQQFLFSFHSQKS